jgi:hypothetical protein
MTTRERMTPRREEGERRSPEPRADPAARVLALQRGAGNAAVAKLLRRDKTPPPQGEPPRPGGWNEGERDVAGTKRIPIDGIKSGNQKPDVKPQSKEGAAGRAVVIVPDGVDLTAKPDVLLFFHGMGNLGYRERITDDSSRGPEGTVHDVEADRMEQQLAHSKRNIVGVLPQGTSAATFDVADPQAYVNDVLALAAGKLSVPAFTAGRIIVSGHSGGGRAAVSAATKMTATAPATDAEWVKAPPLFLFDGINGPNETNAIGDLMEQWLDADLVRLKASKDPAALLKLRAIRLRSTHTSSSLYTATNVGGKYDTEVPDGVDEQNKPKTKTVQITIAKDRSLKGRIDGWFSKHGAELGPVQATLRAQYDVPDQAVSGGHEATVGTGSLETDPKKRDAAPGGLTGASQKAGVPSYSGGGHLEDSLSRLPPDALLPPPPPPPKHAELDETEPEAQYA